MHNPNPFDFVPFAAHPFLQTPRDFDALGDAVSGYLELQIEALTPLHIVGYQEQRRIDGQSFQYRQNSRACVPSASIRGCLRSIIEALTSGWVSQATPEYPKGYRKRHVGFKAFETYPSKGRRFTRTSPPAVGPDFKPQARPDGKIDLASYLFGIVVEPEEGAKTKHNSLARKAKVWIEDAFVADANLIRRHFWIPDIAGEAFMGGAKPSASNWWYFQPDEIWKRSINGRDTAEFVGGKYWGRKFYFHQDPQKCVEYYIPEKRNWDYRPGRDFHRVWLESVKPGTASGAFRIYLDRVPRPLAALLVLALLPGENIRHKLGYGKAYGFGSIEFSLVSAHLREDDGSARIPPPLGDRGDEVRVWLQGGWSQEHLAALKIAALVDRAALEALARILGWQPSQDLRFTYPPFNKGNFATPIAFGQLPAGISVAKVNPRQAYNIAVQLLNIKKPLHFRKYQDSAEGWDAVAKRVP